ncbi:MAG: pyridoxamine 5'-phosphate oxidase family protein [Comamonadaceae bacterium]|nr:pyridoxamine 5'-phosphate oxidase family protein [Comamonadaceae bacterium]
MLASHTTALPGYPYASILPFAPDQESHPVFLVSGLAEHTQNLLADPRASFLVWDGGDGSVLTGARLTLVGKRASPSPPTRCWRSAICATSRTPGAICNSAISASSGCKPSACATSPASAAWVGSKGERLDAAASVALTEEAALIERLQARLQPPQELLGWTPWGADLRQGPPRRRLHFLRAPRRRGRHRAGICSGDGTR